jgi:hypothetical protein
MNPPGRSPDGWDIALLVIGVAGVALSLLAATAAGVLSLIDALRGSPAASQIAEWGAVAMITMAAAGLPAIYLGGRAVLFRRGSPPSRPSARWLLALIGFPLGLGAGYLAFERGLLSGLLTPPTQWLTALLPILVAVTLARHAGPFLPPRRAWGQFLAGAWAVPVLALVTEVIALVPVLTIIGVWMIATREGQAVLEGLRALEMTPTSPIDDTVIGLLLQPWVILPLLTYVSLLVPMIEEALKSMAVWPLLGRGITAAEAFAGGALGGAGYALFEALFLTQPGAGWLTTSVGRTGASIMHTFTAALTSWGLFEGLRRRRWGRLVGAYVTSVAIHGLWNASAIGIGWVTAGSQAGIPLIPSGLSLILQVVGILILAALSGGALLGLARVPRWLTSRDESEALARPGAPTG